MTKVKQGFPLPKLFCKTFGFCKESSVIHTRNQFLNEMQAASKTEKILENSLIELNNAFKTSEFSYRKLLCDNLLSLN